MIGAEQAGRDLAVIALDNMSGCDAYGENYEHNLDLLAKMFASAMRNAVELTREECITIAVAHGADKVADAIRARGTK